MSKYIIKMGISNSIESTLVNDLNAFSHVIYSAGGNITNLNVKSRSRQICVQIEGQADVIQGLLETKVFNTDLIKSVFLIEEDSGGYDQGFFEELGFAGFFHSRYVPNNLATQVYPC